MSLNSNSTNHTQVMTLDAQANMVELTVHMLIDNNNVLHKQNDVLTDAKIKLFALNQQYVSEIKRWRDEYKTFNLIGQYSKRTRKYLKYMIVQNAIQFEQSFDENDRQNAERLMNASVFICGSIDEQIEKETNEIPLEKEATEEHIEDDHTQYTIHPKNWMDEIIEKYRECEEAEEFDVYRRTHELDQPYDLDQFDEPNSFEHNFADEQINEYEEAEEFEIYQRTHELEQPDVLEQFYEPNSFEQNFADEQINELHKFFDNAEAQIAESMFDKIAVSIYNDYVQPKPERIDTPELAQILDELGQYPNLPTQPDYYTFVCKETNWKHVAIPHPQYGFYGDDNYDNRPKPYETNFWEFIVKYNLDTIIISTSEMPKNIQFNCYKVKSIEHENLMVKVIRPIIDIEENGQTIPVPKPTDTMFWKWALFHDLVLDVEKFPILKQMKVDIDAIKELRQYESYHDIYGSILT